MSDGLLTYDGVRFEWLGGWDTKAEPDRAKFAWDPVAKRRWTTDPDRAALLKEHADDKAAHVLELIDNGRLLGYDGEKWIWRGGYRTRERPHEAGFRWDDDNKIWWTNEVEKAWEVSDCGDPESMTPILEAFERRRKSEALSRAVDADVEVPVPEGCELLPFQKASVAYALGRPATLIADEMGLGKTPMAVGVANKTRARLILIVCPLSVKLNWEREIAKWSTADPPLSVGHATAQAWPQTDVVVCHWNVLACHEAELRSREWDLAILDEAHLAKNKKAQRSQAIYGRKGLKPVEAKRKLALTGTPVPNRPKELWPVLNWLGLPLAAGKWKEFHETYCGPRLVFQGRERGEQWVYDGASNLDELQEKLRQQGMVRHLKRDVLAELPPKRRQVVLLDPSDVKGSAAVLKKEAERLEELRIKALVEAELAKAEGPGAYEAAVRRLEDPGEIEFKEMSAVRHETALVKAPAVAAHVSDLLDQGTAKVIVWAHHHDVIDVLSEALDGYGTVVVTGDTPQAQRQEAVDSFQSEGGPRVFIGNMEAAGTGITLTAASTAVFAELAWSPHVVSQAEDRCHRIGQPDAVLAQHILLDRSFDARVANTILSKQAIADRALDAKPAGAPGPEPVERTKERTEVPVQVQEEGEEQMATQTTSRDRIANIAARMTTDDVTAMHQGVRQLAGWDTDHARSLNGAGFSKLDSALGHELAEKQSLTPKQGALAAVLCQRYRRQLGELGDRASAIVTGKPQPTVDLKLPEPPPLMPQAADDFSSFDEEL